MSLWSRYKAWQDRPWTVEWTMEEPVILPGANDDLRELLKVATRGGLGCFQCHRFLGMDVDCREYESCCKGHHPWHPVGTIRVEEGDG